MASKNTQNVSLASFRTVADVRAAFASTNTNTAHAVRDLVIRTAQFMQAGEVSVRTLQRELEGALEGTVKIGDIAYFGVAQAIYALPDSIGVMKGTDARAVLVMATRLQKQLKKDGALAKVEELRKAKAPFSEWGKMVPKTNAPKNDGKPKPEGKGKPSDQADAKAIYTLDDLVLNVLAWLGKNKDQRKTSQPDAVAQLVAILTDEVR